MTLKGLNPGSTQQSMRRREARSLRENQKAEARGQIPADSPAELTKHPFGPIAPDGGPKTPPHNDAQLGLHMLRSANLYIEQRCRYSLAPLLDPFNVAGASQEKVRSLLRCLHDAFRTGPVSVLDPLPAGITTGEAHVVVEDSAVLWPSIPGPVSTSMAMARGKDLYGQAGAALGPTAG